MRIFYNFITGNNVPSVASMPIKEKEPKKNLLSKKRRENDGILFDERKEKAKHLRKNEIIILDKRKPKAKHPRNNEEIIVHERKAKAKSQRKNEEMIVDEEKEQVNEDMIVDDEKEKVNEDMIVDEEKELVIILIERERETYLRNWDNCNLNPTFNNLSWIYDDILCLLKNNIHFGPSIAKFNNVLDSTISIIFSNYTSNKESIDNW